MANIVRKLSVAAIFFLVLACFGAAAYYVAHAGERDLKKTLFDEENRVAQAFFSPDDDLRSILIALIKEEKQKIRIAIYTFTDKQISTALLHAHDNGVQIELVVDPSYGTDRYSKVYQLANADIPVWVYQPQGEGRDSSLMHNKFALFSDNVDHRELIWIGSYNFTVRANERNQEDMIVLDNKRIIARFENQFEILKERSIQISGKIQNSARRNSPSESSWLKKLFRLLST